MSVALLIPSYEPRERVVGFLSQFQREDFDYFLVVDDGSGSDYASIFEDIKSKTVFEVIGYQANKGKGNALKHGLKYLLEMHPDLSGVVTADSDGQHLREDILRVKKTLLEKQKGLVLGCRDFENAPIKSKNGNLWSSRYFKIMTGIDIQDSQTGLRGVNKDLFPLFLSTHGTRFEFEMNFLLDAASIAPLTQISIETVYEGGKNEGTHFRPVKDSLRIASGLIAYALIATIYPIISIVLFAVFEHLFFAPSMIEAWGNGTILSLISIFGSGLVCYFMLQFAAFFQKVPLWKSFLKNSGVLLCFLILQTPFVFLLWHNNQSAIWLSVLFSLLFTGIKIILDYRFIFALKKNQY